MSKKLNDIIKRKIKSNNKLLSIFVTAGFPELDATVDIIKTLDKSGVDFIELGMPFSDPIADGPVIQKATDTALRNGTKLEDIFQIIKDVRKFSDIPILLMGYLNPLYHYGLDKFLVTAAKAGADGLIIPDWPIEENIEYHSKLKELDLDLIHLIAPNTPPERIKLIDKVSTSFIYCVAYTGVTGQGGRLNAKSKAFLSQLQKELTNPWMVGFGVRTFADVQRYTSFSDGVIVGSAFINLLEQTEKLKRSVEVKKFIAGLQGKDQS